MTTSLTLTPDQQIDKLIDVLDREYGGVLSERQEELLLQFSEFHATNPHVYKGFVDVSFAMRDAGQRKWSIAGAIEVLRWQTAMGATTDANYRYKIANAYKPLYARMLMECEPALDGFFDIATQTC